MFRKYLSGSEKLKKKQTEKYINSIRGSLVKFLNNPNIDGSNDSDIITKFNVSSNT